MRSSRSYLTTLSIAAALLVVAGCRGTEIEDAIDKVDWFGNMRDQAALEPFEEPARMPPEGTISVGAGVPLGSTADDYEAVLNPIAATAENLELGQALYDIYCSVCHGAEGSGGGSIEGPFPRGLINMLTTQRAQDLTDGYIFGMMAVGRGLMPNYRRITQEERWLIVNYIRQLQELYGE